MSFITRSSVIHVTASLVTWLTLVGPGISGAADREYVLRWIPGLGAAASGYRVYLATGEAPFSSFLDVGAVDPDEDGIARATLTLDALQTYRAAMTAYNGAGESGFSNEIGIAALACEGCPDADPCTADACGPAGCSQAPVPDGTACGGSDVCRTGVCMPLDCRAAGDCDDGDLCNGAESCSRGGACAPGAALDCGQPTQCSAPRCDAQLGCLTTALPDGTACDDGLGATGPDSCGSGTCVPGNSWATRQYGLRWIPGQGASATGYRLYLAVAGAPFANAMDLAGVAAGGDGIARATVSLDAFRTYWAAMTAYNAAGESQLSNLIEISPLACHAVCDDANSCTIDQCGASACSHSQAPDGTPCAGPGVCRSGACEPSACLVAGGCGASDPPGCSIASTRDYTLRWMPGQGASANGYRVYLSTGGTAFSSGIDLGAVLPGWDGVARATFSLPASTSYRAAMTAYNHAGESALSNAIEIAALPCDAELSQVPPAAQTPRSGDL